MTNLEANRTTTSITMVIYEVLNRKMGQKFLAVPKRLYARDRAWIGALEDDVRSVFDPRKNHFFKHGKCRRWVAVNEFGETIGRIAAFIDHEKARTTDTPYGGIGFFESINDQAVAFRLLDTAKYWLKRQGMKAMFGPINFGENDKFWGLLIEGFTTPSYGMNYNPPYYKKIFEDYGFIKAYDQLTNVLDATQPLPQRFSKIADWVMSKPEYGFRHFAVSEKEKFFRDFMEIYNDAWNDFENFTPIDLHTIRDSFRQLKPVMDEKIIWFAYYNNEPVAFVLCMPDVNQILKHIRGRMNWYNKLKFLWLRRTKKVERIRITVMGCKKNFQNHGLESALIRCLEKEVVPRKTVREVELAWVGDFNSKMMAIHQATGAVRSKLHRTYRYTFDD